MPDQLVDLLINNLINLTDRLARNTMFTYDGFMGRPYYTGQRPSAPDVMVIITDGISNDKTSTLREAVRTRGQNISIVTVSVYNMFILP